MIRSIVAETVIKRVAKRVAERNEISKKESKSMRFREPVREARKIYPSRYYLL